MTLDVAACMVVGSHAQTALYERYCPEKVANIDKLLVKYAGNEKALLKAVEEKYAESDARGR